jgi:hypothetical protein
MIDKASPERVSPPVSYARKDTDGFWYVAVTWGSGRHERLGPIELKPPPKNTSRRNWTLARGPKFISETNFWCQIANLSRNIALQQARPRF